MYGMNNYNNPFAGASAGYNQPGGMMGYSPMTNMLPAQKIVEVHGKESIQTLRMAPNSSALLMDNTAPIVWMAISDGVGQVTATPFDIAEHKEAPPVDVPSMEKRLAAVEQNLMKLMEDKKHGTESDDGGTQAGADSAGTLTV